MRLIAEVNVSENELIKIDQRTKSAEQVRSSSIQKCGMNSIMTKHDENIVDQIGGIKPAQILL